MRFAFLLLVGSLAGCCGGLERVEADRFQRLAEEKDTNTMFASHFIGIAGNEAYARVWQMVPLWWDVDEVVWAYVDELPPEFVARLRAQMAKAARAPNAEPRVPGVGPAGVEPR